MLYREIIAVCSEIHTKHINTLCGQNVELLDVKPGGTYSDQWALDSSVYSVAKYFVELSYTPEANTFNIATDMYSCLFGRAVVECYVGTFRRHSQNVMLQAAAVVTSLSQILIPLY
jgi:hypothetical protein